MPKMSAAAASTSTIAVVTTGTTIRDTVDTATLSDFADLTGKVADGTIGMKASDTVGTTGMQTLSVRGPTAHGGPSQKTNGPAQPLGLKPLSGLKRAHLLQIAVGRSPPLGYRRLDDAPPAREGTREIKRSESPPPPSPSGLMIK